MRTDKISDDQIKSAVRTWASVVAAKTQELRKGLSELELSALASWPEDSFESFQEILDSLEKMREIPESDSDQLHQGVVDIYWQLDHIEKHINDAKKGFVVLMNLLGAR